MPACKTCGEMIVWAKTEKGKAIPLDAMPEKRFVVTNASGTEPTVKYVETYQVHFIKCPNSEKSRRVHT